MFRMKKNNMVINVLTENQRDAFILNDWQNITNMQEMSYEHKTMPFNTNVNNYVNYDAMSDEQLYDIATKNNIDSVGMSRRKLINALKKQGEENDN